MGLLSQADKDAVDSIVATVMKAGPQPGVAVSITGPKGDYAKAYGLGKIVAAKTPMNLLGHVRIGSITKMITALAVFQQVDAGKLSLDDKLDKFVDGVPAGDLITIQHMMMMRSGVYEYTQNGRFQLKSYLTPSFKWNQQDALKLIRSNPSRFTPGEKYDYADSNYVLLGLVLEKLTGETHEDVIELVIDELGLTESHYPLGNTAAGTKLPAPVIYGYRQNPIGAQYPPQDTTVCNPEMFGASGAIVSTVGDLQILGQKLRDGALLTPETRKLRDTTFVSVPYTYEGPTEFGYGMGILKFGDWLGHGGSVPGYTTSCMFHPETGAVISVVENYQTQEAQAFSRIWRRIADHLYPGTVG